MIAGLLGLLFIVTIVYFIIFFSRSRKIYDLYEEAEVLFFSKNIEVIKSASHAKLFRKFNDENSVDEFEFESKTRKCFMDFLLLLFYPVIARIIEIVMGDFQEAYLSIFAIFFGILFLIIRQIKQINLFNKGINVLHTYPNITEEDIEPYKDTQSKKTTSNVNVILLSAGNDKPSVANGLSMMTGVKEKKALKIIKEAPVLLAENMSVSDAETIKKFLENRGAKVEIEK